MQSSSRMEKIPQCLAAFWISFAFMIWIFTFRGFLSSKFELTSDALSYYDHTRFFIENLRHGIYPLWDPFWFNGAPNDFFLRRIGAFNPLYLIILLLKSVGIPYTLSYLWFLAAYYWSGMIAFYLLAMRIYQNRFLAYTGYLILLFSALGTRLFDSYMMLVTVPLIWFAGLPCTGSLLRRIFSGRSATHTRCPVPNRPASSTMRSQPASTLRTSR